MQDFLDLFRNVPQAEIFQQDFGKLIGRGAHAVVFKSKSEPEKIAYRVEQFLKDQSSHIERGVAIQRFLFQEKISPCIPEIYQTVVTKTLNNKDLLYLFDTTSDDFTQNELVRYLIVKMEIGNLGSLRKASKYDIDVKTYEKLLFMLMWTCWVANSRYGFRHRDIKPDNIVLKRLPSVQTFQFTVEGHEPFVIETDIVPLLIDYDFASLLTTRAVVRYAKGTLDYLPPEVLSNSLLHPVLGSPTAFVDEAFDEDSVDFWALGLTFTSMFTAPLFILDVLPATLDITAFLPWQNHPVFAEHLEQTDEKIEVSAILLLNIMYFLWALNQQIAPNSYLLGTTYSPAIFSKKFIEDVVVFQKAYDLEAVYKTAVERIPKEMLGILRRLLHWDVGFRTKYGKFYKIFPLFFASFQTPRSVQGNVLKYHNAAIPLFWRSRDEKFKERAFNRVSKLRYVYSQVCEKCGTDSSLFICQDCSEITCGENCHTSCLKLKAFF